MIGICIPAHNEEDLIDACLESVAMATLHPDLAGEEVKVVVVLDSCSDGSAAIARQWPFVTLAVNARNVGRARAAGARHLLQHQARWLAFTDADTRVAPDWLAVQLSLGADVVCGTVGVDSWDAHGADAKAARLRFESSYQDRDGHRHVHGANLGLSAQCYQQAGGFDAIECGEDQALVDRLAALGAQIAWSASPRVLTSGRPYSRVEHGFAGAIRQAPATALR
ncbi:glycosyltransferase [Comamonas koreensis]|uniref:Glycosyltransferase n=1 Tax=Comamonas koreensis TaxID=160825 RepID=A0AAW4XZT2_9BURK|nr:glycosyltransferase family 2 protein [Comamonas koreensis]MCD2166161.1 glycosyltransferase [Comamonas koreensis]